jgi:hypothetical protein
MAYWSKSRGKVYDKLLRTLEAGQKNKTVYANSYETTSNAANVALTGSTRMIVR